MPQVRKNSVKRAAILDALRRSKEHPSAEMLYEQLRSEYPELSLGTVYRNLSLFCEDGLAKSLCTVQGKERFEGDLAPHAHLICRCCGRVEDVRLPVYSADMIAAWGMEHGFSVEEVNTSFSGLCRFCAAE